MNTHTFSIALAALSLLFTASGCGDAGPAGARGDVTTRTSRSSLTATLGQATCYETDTQAGHDGQTALDAFCGARIGGRIYITENTQTGCWEGSVVCYGSGEEWNY